MHDRLKSVKLSRTLRNVCLCLSLGFLLEFVFLLGNALAPGRRFLAVTLILLLLSALCGYLAYYYHVRFRSRD